MVEVYKPFQSFHGYTVTLYIMYIYYFAVTRLTAAAQTSRTAPDRKINEILVALLLVYECACDHRSQSTVEIQNTKKIRSNRTEYSPHTLHATRFLISNYMGRHYPSQLDDDDDYSSTIRDAAERSNVFTEITCSPAAGCTYLLPNILSYDL